MDRLLAWIGALVGTVIAGPGAVVIGDPGIDLLDPTDPTDVTDVTDPTDPVDPAEGARPARLPQVALLGVIVTILLFAGLPLPVGGAMVLIGLVFIFRPRWIPT